MEVTYLADSSLRIKSKNSTFIVNPSGKLDGEVILLTQKPTSYASFGVSLVIDGPGEYEVAGVSIKADQVDGKNSFHFLEDNQSLLVLASAAAARNRETDEYTAAVVLMDEKMDNLLSTLTAQVVAVAGSDEFLPQEKDSIKKTDKLNLKKTEEYKGFIVHLSK